MTIGHRMYLCPVCRFSLDFEPWRGDLPSDEICPCCGTQFGYHDFAGGKVENRPAKHAELRHNWIKSGKPWIGASEEKPPTWDPQRQLLDSGFEP